VAAKCLSRTIFISEIGHVLHDLYLDFQKNRDTEVDSLVLIISASGEGHAA
jgi:hypothetical protein